MEIKDGIKIRSLTPRLSRSVEVSGTDTDRSATYNFLLVFRSYCGPISRTDSEIDSDICQIFPPLVFNAPAEGAPFGIF